MQCPVCKDTQLVMSERKSIEIDYCPNCRGVWLDRGELDKIIEKSAESTPTSTSAPYSDTRERERDNHGYAKPKHYKNKSFLSELFD
ncbi:zf-TFIIB domain-containing protein [Yersinia sp. 2466 StPb PI]|uniref:TFIIB-type zinc ribbon-containing protein n=1 Tax=Yersinia sp. 2466 StPb PI TaxID=3061648 RepID=UPI00355C6E40